jgi:23S rRNA (pseudouridine1915-N3)-methyltransferase
MRLVVIQTGRIKDGNIRALRDEYLKRFTRFGALTVMEKEPRGETPLWPAHARWKVALDETGTPCSSQELAQLLRQWTMRHGEVAFLIGSAYGHHAASLAGADQRLSLGRLTLPHQIAHLLLIEQLYRSATILVGGAYHHG